MTISPLTGTLLIYRDPDETSKTVPGPNGPVTIHFADDMASANIHSWAASSRMRPSGICMLHSPSRGWQHEEVESLVGLRVFFEKWSERAFELEGLTLYVLDERSVLAYEQEHIS